MLKTGMKAFIETTTKYWTGEVEDFDFDYIVLKKAAWIPDTGRLSDCFTTGECAEVEPYPDNVMVRVKIDQIVNVTDWPFPLPRTRK